MPLDEKEALLVGEMKAQLERCFGRIEKLEKNTEALSKLVTAVEKMVDENKRINARLGIVETDVKTLTGKSGKRWDNLVDKIIWSIAGGLVAYALLQMGFVA